MNYLHWFQQLGICVPGVIAIWLAMGRAPKWAPIFGLASEPFWLWTAIEHSQWGIIALCVLYTASWARGIKTHWMKPTCQMSNCADRGKHPADADHQYVDEWDGVLGRPGPLPVDWYDRAAGMTDAMRQGARLDSPDPATLEPRDFDTATCTAKVRYMHEQPQDFMEETS